MTSWQKAVKYAAMALAIIMTVSIIGGIVSAVTSFAFAFGLTDEVGEMRTYEVKDGISHLDIKIKGAALDVKLGESFSVESNIVNLSVSDLGGTLSVKQGGSFMWGRSSSGRVTVTVPKETVFDRVSISAGAGKVTIDSLSAKHLKLDLGAGEVKIKSLVATESADIDGGAGKVTVESGEFNKLDLDMGVGEFNLTARLSGRNTLDMGIGKANITLVGKSDEYRIDVDKGIGASKIDGTSVGSGTYGNGDTEVEIDGGIGAMEISFKEITDQ